MQCMKVIDCELLGESVKRVLWRVVQAIRKAFVKE